MNYDEAQDIAVQALRYFANNEDALTSLLRVTGLDFKSLLELAGHAETQAGILDFLLSDEKFLLEFCREARLDPSAPAAARAEFPGGGSDD